MIYWILSAWVMGFIGSAHCVGMCGPLAMTLPHTASDSVGRMFTALIYNLGRVLTYAVFGSLIGLTHQWLVPMAFQSQVSVVMGIVLVLLSLYYLFLQRRLIISGGQNSVYRWISRTIGRLYSKPSNASVFLVGILNGLLPCGLVYMALATAFASASIYKSVTFMAFFGLGTLPAMWSVVFFSQYFTPRLRMVFRKIIPLLYVIAGAMLIFRGLGDHTPLGRLMHGQSIYCSK
ncbi:MAG: sulfite exporter TauE/SafE family protein [Chitinophagaceae bacterium]|nr:sulfite exporter TauE/SafE family protein [Chitinophagaceae bacterium]